MTSQYNKMEHLLCGMILMRVLHTILPVAIMHNDYSFKNFTDSTFSGSGLVEFPTDNKNIIGEINRQNKS